MQHTSEPLFSELNRLRAVFSPLRNRLAEAGKQLHESAVPLPEKLVSDLAEFKKSVAELGGRVQGAARELSISTDLPVGDLDEIGRGLDTIAREEQRAKPYSREKPPSVEPDMQESIVEAIRVANLCREQGKNSEADRIYQSLLEVPRNTAGVQSPRQAETPDAFAAAGTGLSQTTPAQPAGIANGALTLVEGDVDQEIDTILESISQLAVKAAEFATTAAANNEAASVSARFFAGKPIAVLNNDADVQQVAEADQVTQETAPPMYEHAGPRSGFDREHPLSAHPLYTNPTFMNPEASKPASRSMIFGVIGLAGTLAVALLAYTTFWHPAATTSQTSSPRAEQPAPTAPTPSVQPQEQVLPSEATEQGKILIPQTPLTPSPVSQATSQAPSQAAQTPQETAPLEAAASQPASPPVRLTPKPSQQTQSAPLLSAVPKPLVVKKDVPEPPRLATGSTGVSPDGEKAVGAALSSLVNPAVRVPPPPSVLAQEPIRIGGQLQAAKLIHMTLPAYPQQYREAHIQGTVRLEAVISKDGAVQKLTVISGNKFLNGPAMDAVKQWRYQPTLLNEEPVAVVTTVDVHFSLSH